MAEVAVAEVAVAIRHFAAAADAAGCTKESVLLPEGASLDAVRTELISRHGFRMERVLKVAAFLVDDELTRDLTRAAGSQVDVLPPFAGG